MELKVFGQNKKRFEENLKDVLSVATLICSHGYVPTKLDIEKAEQFGRWYVQDLPNRYNLLPIVNDYWANIRGRGENFIILEFNIRYDKGNVKKLALSNLLLAWFTFVVESTEYSQKAENLIKERGYTTAVVDVKTWIDNPNINTETREFYVKVLDEIYNTINI